MQAGSHDVDTLRRLVLEQTSGQGADQTIVVAGSRSNDTINLAMDLTRRKGRVVVVGDVGLGVERAAFYRKEIDLLISTSYGPGRYDRAYEEGGRRLPLRVRPLDPQPQYAGLCRTCGQRADRRRLAD